MLVLLSFRGDLYYGGQNASVGSGGVVKSSPALYIVACIEDTMDAEFVQPWLEKCSIDDTVTIELYGWRYIESIALESKLKLN